MRQCLCNKILMFLKEFSMEHKNAISTVTSLEKTVTTFIMQPNQLDTELFK